MLRTSLKIAAIAGLTTTSIANAEPTELITNGGFEEPGALVGGCIGNTNSWFTCPSTDVDGWTVEWVDETLSVDEGRLEFQTGSVVAPVPVGTYKAELASHHRNGQGGTLDNRALIKQTVSGLCPYDDYTLNFQSRKREGNDILSVEVNDNPKGDFTNGDWTTDTINITGSSSVTISFAETGPAGTLGSLLDAVSLTKNDEDSTNCPTLDAKPQSNPNAVNLCKSGGVIPVAFVGNEYFDPNNYIIEGVFISATETLTMGKGKSDICVIEDVVDDSNPDGPVYDGFPDLVCHIPTETFATMVNAEGVNAEAEVCVALEDIHTGEEITLCATDELKLTKMCDD